MNTGKYIFVLMPFSDDFTDIYQYGIKSTCNSKGFFCERVDEQVFEGTILSRIYNQIRKADLIISDLTNKNPNVFYETGFAHALEKPVILLTQNIEDIPFDLKHYPHIIYNGKIKDLSSMLEKKLDWYIKNFNEKNNRSSKISLYNNGIPIENNNVLRLYWVKQEISIQEVQACLNLDIDIYNENYSRADSIESVSLTFYNNGLFSDEVFNGSNANFIETRIKLPNNRILVKTGSSIRIGALSWQKINLSIINEGSLVCGIEELNNQLRDGRLQVLFEKSEPIEYEVHFEITTSHLNARKL